MKYFKYFFIFLFILNSCAIVKIDKIEKLNYSSEYKIAMNYLDQGNYKAMLNKVEFVMKKISKHKNNVINEYYRCQKMFDKNENLCREEKIELEDIEEWEKKFIDLKKIAQDKILKKDS